MQTDRQDNQQPEAAGQDEEPLYYSVAEVAQRLNVSKRWLEDQCRSELVEHVHMARKRKFTPAQVKKLLEKHTVTPPKMQTRDRSMARIARRVERELPKRR
jgi:hypothetical protein